MTAPDYFSVFSSIATLITALLIFLTLREMARQRKASIVPLLVPVKQDIAARRDNLTGTNCPSNWQECIHDENADENPEDLSFARNDYRIALYNLGNGAGKEINIEWVYDCTGFIESINKLSQQVFANLFLEISDSNWLMCKGKDNLDRLFNLNIDLKEHHDYVLPSSVEKSGIKVRVPVTYIYMVSLYFRLSGKSESRSAFDMLEEYPLKLSMSYYDIYGSKLFSSYEFRVNVYAVFFGAQADDVIGFDGQFTVKQLK